MIIENKDKHLIYQNLEENLETHETIYLYQKDFDCGTFIINESGKYCLAENISFNPNSYPGFGCHKIIKKNIKDKNLTMVSFQQY